MNVCERDAERAIGERLSSPLETLSASAGLAG